MSVCLSMVVKNEAALIRSALRSVLPFIDRWAIVDTGSVDGTPDIIRKELKGIEGKLFFRQWKDYGSNRTEAIELAKESGCDFIFILDADETIIAPDGVSLPALDPDRAYWIDIRYGDTTYSRPNLISVKQDWRYVGVTHEYLTAAPMPEAVKLPISIQTNLTRCTKSVERCRQDEQILRHALIDDPENTRYVFYLAQSLRDAGDIEAAIESYQRRAEMGGWYEERWYALFQVAQLKEKQSYPEAEVVNAYLQAHEANPARSESLGALARYLRRAGRYELAFIFADLAKDIHRPNELLFLDESYYQWRNFDEFSISAYWTGRYDFSVAACRALLDSGNLPESEIERVRRNLAFAEEKGIAA